MSQTDPSCQASPKSPAVGFTRQGLARGFLDSLPLAASVAAFGAVYGMLARQAGMSMAEAVLASLIVFAGASQLVVLDLWVEPLPIMAMVLVVLVVNLRHVLMGATLRGWLGCLTPARAYSSLFFMTDEAWAMSLKDMASGGRDAAYLVGAGLAIYSFWVASTALGAVFGRLVSDPAAWGLDYAFTAVFLALLVMLWRGKGDAPAWVVAGALALLTQALLPGKWYILIGGLAGGLTGALSRPKADARGEER